EAHGSFSLLYSLAMRSISSSTFTAKLWNQPFWPNVWLQQIQGALSSLVLGLFHAADFVHLGFFNLPVMFRKDDVNLDTPCVYKRYASRSNSMKCHTECGDISR